MTNNQTLMELKAQLQKAAILELTTIAPYLTAEFSIPKKDVEGKAINSEAVNRLHKIFVEEMQHCAKVSKMLYSIGGEVQFNSDTIPKFPFKAEFVGNEKFPEPYFGRRDLEINLESYSKNSLRTFLEIEKPDYLKVEESRFMGTREEVYDAYTIGEFYQLIEININKLFKENPEFVLRGLYTSKDAILNDLKLIAEQGEGNIDHIDVNNHFYKFLELYNEREFVSTDKLDVVPSNKEYPVSTGKTLELDKSILIIKNAKHIDYVGNDRLSSLNLQFNTAYTNLLKIMQTEYNAGRDALSNGNFRMVMFSLRGIGENMMEIEFAKDEDGNSIFGAPSFEWQE